MGQGKFVKMDEVTEKYPQLAYKFLESKMQWRDNTLNNFLGQIGKNTIISNEIFIEIWFENF